MLSQALKSFAFPLLSCLHKYPRSARDESLGPSQIFAEHMHNFGPIPHPVPGHSLLDSREYAGTFQRLLQYSPDFCFKPFGWHIVAATVIHHLRRSGCETVVADTFLQLALGETRPG